MNLQQLSPQTSIRNQSGNMQDVCTRRKSRIKNTGFSDTEINTFIFSSTWAMIQIFVHLNFLRNSVKHCSAAPNVPITKQRSGGGSQAQRGDPLGGAWCCFHTASHTWTRAAQQASQHLPVLHTPCEKCSSPQLTQFSCELRMVTWEPFNFHKTESESFIVPRRCFLCFMKIPSVWQSS